VFNTAFHSCNSCLKFVSLINKNSAEGGKHKNFYIMNLLGNILWIIFGGFFAALGYFIGGLVLCLTVVGIPFGLQCFKLAVAVLAPFGRRIESTPGSSGCLTLFLNIIWLLCGGLFTAINHIFWGIILAITIIGLPFAKQHFKLVEISLMPFGKRLA
jgi:uncharacterized membrane protein YccF (DUF307 family)